MADENSKNTDVFSKDDPLDINELAALNDDISFEFIEQLQKQVSESAGISEPPSAENNLTELFEEVENTEVKKKTVDLNKDIDDNFIKKYKARLNKQKLNTEQAAAQKEETPQTVTPEAVAPPVESEIPIPSQEQMPEQPPEQVEITQETPIETVVPAAVSEKTFPVNNISGEEINSLTNGNITEKPLNNSQGVVFEPQSNNGTYSKYIIYVDQENKDFMESLTVKERKNLINRILREQDDIAINKRRFNVIISAIKHLIIAIITISITIPVVYYIINNSLEASINNYRRSQTVFKTLYKEKGKIKSQQSHY